ncbi:MAG: membrane protein insertion efficiency factor YidD [Alphaproteobacteria bacterium]
MNMKSFIYIAKLLISFYQLFISPFLGSNCRFHPSCSNYAKDAIEAHGIIKGGFLTVKRLLKCNPLFAGGEDLVPKKQKFK